MGNSKSTQESPESQSITSHHHYDYHTHTDGNTGRGARLEEAKILSNNLNRFYQQEDNVLGVVESEGKVDPNHRPDQRDLTIGFDRKDTSPPLSGTIGSISML